MTRRPICLTSAELRTADRPRLVRFLLALALRRLRQAERMEKTRSIVFPETSVISKDCLRLASMLENFAAAKKAAEPRKTYQRKVRL